MALSRRKLLIAGGAGAAALALGLRPSDKGQPHSEYFQQLSLALDKQKLAKPTLVIDKQKLTQNIQTLKGHIQQRFDYRIVAKSLPSVDLLEYVMQQSQSNKLMLFHQPFLNQVAERVPHADVLLGKPLPVNAAQSFYQQLAAHSAFDPQQQLQWLIDSPERLEQYAKLAQQLNQQLLVNIELDIGLHRGGVKDQQQLAAMLEQIKQQPLLKFSGFMGYEPHVAKAPGSPEYYRDQAMAQYQQHITTAKQVLGKEWPENVTLNAAGSPTYQLYDQGDFPFNELSAGSCLVKPTDFDLPTLADHLPASYIATPVLKKSDKLELPVPVVGDLMSLWDPNRQQTFFTYGGYWKALPESPKGLSINPLFGRSTNQEMLNGSTSVPLEVDDWVFLRPTQSEFVFLQFGDIALLDQGQISGYWPVFSG